MNATRIPSGLSVLLIASEIFGTKGMQTVDVQLRSNGTWFGIRVFTRSMNAIPKDKASQLVYKLSCQDCTTVYIGETSRSVADRMKEHSRLTKRHPKNNKE